jgi:hypothetical protein
MTEAPTCGHCFKPVHPHEPALLWSLDQPGGVGILIDMHGECAIRLGRELTHDGIEAVRRARSLGFQSPMTLPEAPSGLEQVPSRELWQTLWQVIPSAMRGELSRHTLDWLARVRKVFQQREFDP